jgi:membrane protein implicated in regulation of membrane protease activity
MEFTQELTQNSGWFALPGFWLGFGLTLIALEFLLPGFVSVFVGVAALLTGVGIRLGWLVSSEESVIFFFVASLFLLLFVRSWIARFFPSQVLHSETDETQQAIGKRCGVLEGFAGDAEGRISYLGTSWKARFKPGSKAEASAGDDVTIVGQENITFWVEPLRGDANVQRIKSKNESTQPEEV